MVSRYANVSDVPLALGVFLASDYYDHIDDPYTISATTLIKPVRQIVLSARVPEDLSLVTLADQMTTRMGAAIHDGIERAWKTNYKAAMAAMGFPQRVIDKVLINPTPDQLTPDSIPIYLEQRLSKKVGKWTVTGKFDFVGEGRVQDFKTASVWSYQNQVNAEKQILQGSIYRWLDPKLITQDEMDIHHIFMDWKAGMVGTDPTYPTQRFKRQIFPLKTVAEMDSYIRRKLELIEKYWDANEADIPECSDEDLWRSEPVFKYYKNPQKMTRSTKNFDTYQEAMIRYIEDGSVGLVKEIPGQVTACKYCGSFAVCGQKDNLIAQGQLILN